MSITGTVIRGSIVWIRLFPTIGHEQSGFRSALVLSDGIIKAHANSTMAFIVPITTRVRGNVFEIPVPPGITVNGALAGNPSITELEGIALADQSRSTDLDARNAIVIGQVDPTSAFYQQVVTYVRAILA